MWVTNEESVINVGDKLEVLDGFVTNIFVLGTIKVRRDIFYNDFVTKMLNVAGKWLWSHHGGHMAIKILVTV